MDKKKIKLIVIIGIIIIIYLFVILVIFGKDINDFFIPKYIVNTDGLFWQYDSDEIFKTVQEFNNIEGEYTLYYNDGTNKKAELKPNFDIFNEGFKGADELSNNNLKYATNIKNFKQIKYNIEEVDIYNTPIVRDVLKEFDFDYLQTFSGNSVTLDLDNDGIDETLYFITNIYRPEDGIKLTAYFLVKEGKIIHTFYKDRTYRYDLFDIVDFENDKNYEIIVNKKIVATDGFDTCYELYGIKDKKWQNIIECDV